MEADSGPRSRPPPASSSARSTTCHPSRPPADLDGRSDLFSLGCTMYHLLSGQVPFPGETVAECLTRRIGGRPYSDHRPPPGPARRDWSRSWTTPGPPARGSLPDGGRGCRSAGDPCERRGRRHLRSATDAGPCPGPSVPQPDASPTLSSAVDLSAPGSGDHPGLASATWSRLVGLVTAQPSAIAFLLLLLVLLVFGLGFTLGYVSAILTGWRGG